MGSVLRWMRALTLASVLVTTGVAGHAAADGAVPAPLLLAVLFVGATLVLAPVLGSPASPLRVAVLVVGGQAILHVCLSVLATNPTGRSGAGMVMPQALRAPRRCPLGWSTVPLPRARRPWPGWEAPISACCWLIWWRVCSWACGSPRVSGLHGRCYGSPLGPWPRRSSFC